jgi:ABC-2 type transport system permease protein
VGHPTRIDPLYYVVNATRAGLTGFNETPAWLSLLVTAAVALAAFATAATIIGRGWRLKP